MDRGTQTIANVMAPLPLVSFLDSFSVQVPTFHTPRRPEDRVWLTPNIKPDHTNSASSESTARQIPPRAILRMEVKKLVEFVESKLAHLRKDPGDELLQITLNPYQKWEISSEGDLMGLALREIVEPITAVLQQVCRRLVVAKNLPDGSSVKHTSQDKTWDKNGVTDFEWKLKYPSGKECPIVVLELKRPFCMKWEDFQRGFVGDLRSAVNAAKRETVTKGRWGTLLGANAVPLVQQCAKYANETPFVALLDWGHLCLFEFETAGRKYYPVSSHFSSVREEQASHAKRLRVSADDMISGIWFDANDMPPGANYRNMILAIALKGLEACL